MKNRILSILLSMFMLILVFATVPNTASALDNADVSTSEDETKGFLFGTRYDGTLVVTKCYPDVTGDTVVIPSMVRNKAVTEIGKSAFKDAVNIKNVIIPDSVEKIDYNAFLNCSSLENVIIPESVKIIRFSAFEGCSSLKSITLPQNIKELESYTFRGCTSLESIVIPENVEHIGIECFKDCVSLEEIVIPEKVTRFNSGAFWGCTNLKNIVFDENCNVKTMETAVFDGCSSLQSIDLTNVTKIQARAFRGCYSLQPVMLSQSVTEIGDNAFEGCVLFTSIDIPSTVKTIGVSAFENCYYLSEVRLHEGLESIGAFAFANCAMTEIEIPASVEEMGYYSVGFLADEEYVYWINDFIIIGEVGSIAELYAETLEVDFAIKEPKLSSISNTTDGVKITFEKLSGVSGQYRIYRKTSETSWKTLANITSNTYTDKTAESGVYYTYTVKFIGYDGTESRYDKNGLSITRLVTPTVTNIANTNDGVKLTISEVKGAAYYRVYYKTSDGWKGIDNTDTTTFVHESAKSGESYTYTVKAFDKYDSSSSFDSKGFTNQYIATPVITAVSSTKNGVQISWNKVTGAGIYRVYVKTDTGWKGLGNTASTTFTDTSATSRGRYTYTVRCMAQDGKTAVSGYDKEGKSCTVFSTASMKEMQSKINKIQRHDGADKYPSSVKPQLNKQQKSRVSIQSLSEKLRLLLNNK